MIDWGVPDVPESLQMKIKRENYLAKQALTDNIEVSIVEVRWCWGYSAITAVYCLWENTSKACLVFLCHA